MRSGVVALRDAIAAAGGMLDRSRAGPSLLSLGVLGVVAILILPVPAGLLDVFFTLSLAGSLVILSLTIFVRSALDFSSFPTVLLVITTFRLALNVASTRLILSEGHNGPGSAGRVIEAFGHFVMGDNLAIGAIVFTVLMLINFLVIAFVVFLIVKAIEATKRKEEAKAEAAAVPDVQAQLASAVTRLADALDRKGL